MLPCSLGNWDLGKTLNPLGIDKTNPVGYSSFTVTRNHEGCNHEPSPSDLLRFEPRTPGTVALDDFCGCRFRTAHPLGDNRAFLFSVTL